MEEAEDLGSLFSNVRNLAGEYVETKVELTKLQSIRILAKTGGYLVWFILSLFLAMLLIIFLGLTAGFWFSHLTGSYTQGFGIATLLLIVFILLLAALRKILFVDPIIRNIIHRSTEVQEADE